MAGEFSVEAHGTCIMVKHGGSSHNRNLLTREGAWSTVQFLAFRDANAYHTINVIRRGVGVVASFVRLDGQYVHADTLRPLARAAA